MMLLRIHCDAAVLLYQSNALLRAKNGRRIHIRLEADMHVTVGRAHDDEFETHSLHEEALPILRS